MPMSSDRDFELAFAELAFSALQDKAPAIVPKVIGFQVLDASDDQAHAIGVFGADVAEQLVYIPAFFHAGEIKGIEMMYLSEQDIFVPMRDAWINYLVTRRPTDLGDAENIPREALSRLAFSLSRMRRGGGSRSKMGGSTLKLGSVRGRPVYYSKGPSPRFVPAFDLLSTPEKRASGGANLDLKEVLFNLPPSATTLLVKIANKVPAVLDSLAEHYGDAGVAEMLCSAKYRSKLAANPEMNSVDSVVLDNQRVHVTDYEQMEPGEFAGLSAEQRADMLRGEFVVRDDRKSVSKVYRAAFKISLSSPKRTDVYDVPTEDGMLRCFIGMKPISLSCPDEPRRYFGGSGGRLPQTTQQRYSNGPPCRPSFGADQRREPMFAVVVNLDGDGVTVGQIEGLMVNDQMRPLAEGIAGRGVPVLSMTEGKRYVLVDHNGHCTDPFTFSTKTKSEDGSTVATVRTELYPNKGNPEKGLASSGGTPIEFDILPIRGSITVAGGRILVPELSTTAIEVKVKSIDYDADTGYPKANYDFCCHGGMPRILSSTQLDKALQAASMVPIAIRGTGTEYKVTLGRESSEKTASIYSKVDAINYLAKGLGIRASAAVTMLKEADALAPKAEALRGWIDLAKGYPSGAVKAGYYVPQTYPSPDTDSELGVPAVSPETTEEGVPGLDGDSYDHSGYDLTKYTGRGAPAPGQHASAVAEAANTGQKDIFDTAAVATLVKTYDAGEMIDRYLSDIILGMDRIGRIYFLLLRHFDQFRERYGAHDTVQLEDSLRNTFRLVGDLVMNLKERDIGSAGNANPNSNEARR